MAYRQVQILAVVVVAAVACLAPVASAATTWMVGDAGGWRGKFNETGWTDGKTFTVGDSLMFMYPKDTHTVAQVGKEDFAACNLQGNMLGGGVMTSGNDMVLLEKPGKMWFICTKPNHCLTGMKMVINVVGSAAAPGGAMAPPPSSAPAVSFGGAVAVAAAAAAAAVLAF